MGFGKEAVAAIQAGGREDVGVGTVEQGANLLRGAAHGRGRGDDLGSGRFGVGKTERFQCGFVQAGNGAERAGDQMQFVLNNQFGRG